MNRLELPTEPLTVPTHTVAWEAQASKASFRVVGTRDRVECTESTVTFSPVHYEDGYAYPLVVWLHGARQNARNLADAMKHISLRNYVAVAPSADLAAERRSNAKPWWQIPDSILNAQERIQEAVDLARQRFCIHEQRIFLVGFDDGGTMALRLALQCPELFAGAATIGGPLPTGHNPLRQVNAIRNTPFLIAAARHSRHYPERLVCENLRLLHSAGATVSVRQYPGSDDLTTQMLADLDRWMMELVGQSNAAIVH